MMFSVFADAIVAVLLIATISYAAVLNRRLGLLRADRAKLEELVNGLTVATQRAEMAVGQLKSVATESGRDLERRTEQAQSLRDDLSYMVERGGTIADRLETGIRARREEPRPDVAPRPRPRAEPKSEPGLRAEPTVASRADIPDPHPDPRPQPRLRPVSKPPVELEEMFEPRRPATTPSRAERELLRALSGLR